MTPRTLRAHIRPLPEYLSRTRAMEQAIGIGVGFDGAWYRSQKEHWLGWLAEYSGPGAYGRSSQTPRDARHAYNHIQCAPMLFWLAEALGVEEPRLDVAFTAVTEIDVKGAPQCAALRRALPWDTVEHQLSLWPYGMIAHLRIGAVTGWA